MDSLARFFELNWVALYFVYGQVFFIIGLVTTLLSRRGSQLELARSLPWLAGFGIIHGFNEWGYVFKPLQEFYVSSSVAAVSEAFHLGLLGVSFYCLLQFGIRLSRPEARTRWRRVGHATLLAWVAAVVLLAALGTLPYMKALEVGDILSRYFMAVPGSILACLGLLRQARIVQEMDMARISRYLRGAAYTFAAYALAGGIMTPAASFPPASWFNYDLLMSSLGIPIAVFRSIIGLVMAYTVFRSLEIFELENQQRIADMERQQVLAQDRERIGRDLHDGIIQSMYASGLRLESAMAHIDPDPEQARTTIKAVLDGLDETIGDIRSYVFDLQRSDGHRELEAILGDLVHDVQLDTYLEAEYHVSGARCCRLPPSRAAELEQIAHEALSNVVRHADAQHVVVNLAYEGGTVRLSVSDDGVGMVDGELIRKGSSGHGLQNLKRRAETLQGELQLRSIPGEGTTVEVVVPCDPFGEAC